VAVGTDEVVVLNADGHDLRIAESVCWRMASAARVVTVERVDLVEPQHPAEIDKLRVNLSTETRLNPLLERLLDVAGEAGRQEHYLQVTI
jgi:hypothetical protein